MEDKTINLGTIAISLLRIECLLEETIAQQILIRNPSFTEDELNEKFKLLPSAE